jgi:hypothetical protein
VDAAHPHKKSLKGIKYNSHGCNPWIKVTKNSPALKGPDKDDLFNPFRVDYAGILFSMGFTHGYSYLSPSGKSSTDGESVLHEISF